MSEALSNLTPEMQARLAQIMAGQQPQGQPQAQAAPAAPTPPPVVKPPSLMDHVIALRQEVHALQQQVAANSDVRRCRRSSSGAAVPDVSTITRAPNSKPVGWPDVLRDVSTTGKQRRLLIVPVGCVNHTLLRKVNTNKLWLINPLESKLRKDSANIYVRDCTSPQ